jgi:hypothetical protein
MDLTNYTGLKVKIILNNKYYYVGKVISADIDSLDLRDFKGQLVSIKKTAIESIQEVAQW